jgi:hypothetical protein
VNDFLAARHRSREQIEAGLDLVQRCPRDVGTLALVVRRPAIDAREVLTSAELHPEVGLRGDSWNQRPSSRMPDSSPHPDMQLNVVNSRFIELIAGPDPQSWALAGDQLYVDLDLSVDTLPAGSRLAIGDHAIIEVTDQPHTGCAKFAARFGRDAHKIVWAEVGKRLRLRGLNARVVAGGTIHQGDPVRRLPPAETPPT